MAPSSKYTHFLDAESVASVVAAKAESLPCSDPELRTQFTTDTCPQPFQDPGLWVQHDFLLQSGNSDVITQQSPVPILGKLLAPLSTNANWSLQAIPFCLSASLLSLWKDILLGHHSLITFLWRGDAHIYFSKPLVLITRIALNPCFIVLAAFISLLLCIGLVKAIRIPHPIVSCWYSSIFIYHNINCSQ